MKFKTIIFVIVNILMIVIMSIFTYNQHYFTGETTLKTYFEAVDAEEYTKTVLFYTSSGSEFVDEQAVEGKIVENVCVISLNDIDMSDTILRLDPINCQGTFSITNIEVLRGNKIILSLSGKKLKSYIDDYYGISKKWENGVLVCEAKNEDPMIFFKQALCDKIDMYQYRYARNIYIVILAIYVCIGIAEVICLAGKEMKKRTYIITSVVTGALIIAAIVILYAGRYFRKQFGQVPFGQLLYHLNTPLEGTDLSSYHDVIWIGVGIAVICLIAYVVLLNLLKKKRAQKGYMLWIAGLAFVLTSYSGVKIVQQFDIVEYYEYIHQKTTLYDDYYVDGRDVELTFPENKRNLIYIFLESMEITYADVEVGGAMEFN